MRKIVLTLVVAVLISLAAASVFAGRPSPQDERKTARAEVAALPPADVRLPAGGALPRTVQDFRDSAALVLVGGMLLGLAAAVRRTA